MWSWYGEQKDEFPKLVEKFQAANPNIKVQNRVFGTPDQYLPALQAAVAAGDVPEIFAPHTRALTYGTGGISADLKKDLGDEFLADIFESANQEYTLDGKQYAIGWMAQTFGIFYNPEILDKAGVDGEAIETWDDLIRAAPKTRPSTSTASRSAATPGRVPSTSSCRCSPRSPTTRPSSCVSTRARTVSPGRTRSWSKRLS